MNGRSCLIYRATLKHGHMTAPGQRYRHRIFQALGCIVKCQARPQPRGLRPDNRVGTRVERIASIQCLHSERVFLQFAGVAIERLFDEKAKEFAGSCGGCKCLAIDHLLSWRRTFAGLTSEAMRRLYGIAGASGNSQILDYKTYVPFWLRTFSRQTTRGYTMASNGEHRHNFIPLSSLVRRPPTAKVQARKWSLGRTRAAYARSVRNVAVGFWPLLLRRSRRIGPCHSPTLDRESPSTTPGKFDEGSLDDHMPPRRSGTRFDRQIAKIVQTPSLIIILYEDLTYRQIFLDGRQPPSDPNPSWMGYSTGRWEGDTLLVESLGFNDRTWLDYSGNPHTEALRIEETYCRVNYSHINLDLTYNDPGAHKTMDAPHKPNSAPGAELIEYVCAENEKDRVHIVGKLSDGAVTYLPGARQIRRQLHDPRKGLVRIDRG